MLADVRRPPVRETVIISSLARYYAIRHLARTERNTLTARNMSSNRDSIVLRLPVLAMLLFSTPVIAGTAESANATRLRDVSFPGDSMQLRVVGNRDGRFVLRWQVPPELSCLLFRVERSVTEGYDRSAEARWIEVGLVPGLCSLFDTIPYFYEDRTAQPDIAGSLQYRLAVRQTNGDTFYSYSEVIALGRPERFEILDVYPQPSAGTVTIRMLLPSDAPVRLRVHDMVGREVHRSTLQPSVPGLFAFPLDLSSLPSGPYVGIMETPDGVVRRPLRLIR